MILSPRARERHARREYQSCGEGHAAGYGNVVVVVVVTTGQSHASARFSPTAFLRQDNASTAVVPLSPFTSQTQLGSHVCEPTAVRNTNRQSLAVGAAPVVTGWLQPARATVVASGSPLNSADVFVVSSNHAVNAPPASET
jgi:hypothetical protein